MKRLLIGIIIFVIAGYCIAGDIYVAQEKDLPDWARQGRFHFLRVDGGRIEAIKASLTDWGAGFSEEEKDILWHVYDRHGEEIIRLLKQAHINWIWITWSNGFSLKEEAENRALCKHFVELCHKQDIKVTAYLSLSNMFWHNLFIDEPQSINWVQLRDGKPVNYGGPHNVERYLADINNPGWRDYVKQRVHLAFDAGFDALFFDNLQNEKQGIKTMFSEIQQMAVEFARKTDKPKPMLFCNVHLDPERLEVNEICEAVWNEYGRSTPGVWDDTWWVDNIRKTKYIKGDLPDWKPQFYDIPITHRGTRETDIYTPKEEKLAIAEAVAFGSELGRNIEGRFLKGLVKKERIALEAWKWISVYNTFIRKNEHLYLEAEPVSHILVLTKFDPLIIDKTSMFDANLQDMLSRQSIQYDISVIQRILKFQRDKKYKAIVVTPSIELTPANKNKLAALLTLGGKILVSPQENKINNNFVQYTDTEIQEIFNQGQSQSFMSRLLSLVPVDQVHIAQPYILASVMEIADKNSRVLHLLNYEDRIVQNLTVELSGLTRKPSKNIMLLSPDAHEASLTTLDSTEDFLKIEINNFDTYALIIY